MRLELPWPDKVLSPNGRYHWAVIAKANREAREVARILGKTGKPPKQPVHLSITFHPPTRHRIDIDNCLSRAKPWLDGLADCWGIDDSEWELSIRKGEVLPKGMMVVEYAQID